jgi:hypothetical protein
MANTICPPSNATHRQMRKWYRGCLVHAAGDTERDCCVTLIFCDPWNPINDLDDPPMEGVGDAVIESGCRIPRSLRSLYQRKCGS